MFVRTSDFIWKYRVQDFPLLFLLFYAHLGDLDGTDTVRGTCIDVSMSLRLGHHQLFRHQTIDSRHQTSDIRYHRVQLVGWRNLPTLCR